MTPTELVFADRSERAKLRFTGEQRAWFLHQVLTQALEDIAPAEARAAAMITAHGRMTGFLEIVALDDALLAHFEPELRSDLPAELQRYVFATRVEIVDVTEAMGLALVAGPGWAAAAGRTGAIVHPTRGIGIPGAYLWAGRDELPQVLDRLTSAGARRASEDELERLRIAGGVPRWGADMNAKTLPQEAGLDDWAVHYDKGCYLGQEAMAKIHHRGKVNRRLRKLAGEEAWEPGADVRHGDDRVGVITSAADGHALAMLRAGVEAGATVSAGGVDGIVVD